MYEHIKNTEIILKKIINTDPIFHLHPCTNTWTSSRTCGPKIGFNKEVEINCISLFHFIKTHFIFDYKVKINYDLNPIAYHHVNYLLLLIFWILMSCYAISWINANNLSHLIIIETQYLLPPEGIWISLAKEFKSSWAMKSVYWLIHRLSILLPFNL